MPKPSLTIVKPAADPRQPPRALGEHGMGLWTRIMSDYRIEDEGGLELLAQACAALDRAEECAAAIDTAGVMVKTKTGLRENPMLKHELANRSFVTRTLQRLGLDVEPVRATVGRPSGAR